MFDLEQYRRRSESFLEEVSREHYLHLAGHKAELEIDSIYSAYSDLFERDAVEELRTLPGGDQRAARYLLHFAFDGFLGRECTQQEEELARLEASLEVEVGGERTGFRQVASKLANEPDGERRAALEEARDELAAEHLDPLRLEMLERAHATCRELGWAGYADAYASLRGLDFDALSAKTQAFLAATNETYAATLDPELAAGELPPIGELRRSDLPRFFRAERLDGGFDGERMIPALRETLGGMGIDLASQANVTVDAEARPTKSPRAFCSTPKVPDEIYLVVAPVGGRDDFDALFHEAGHTEHYAHVDSGMPFEHRHLGDNAVTESFAFLIQHLVADPIWLSEVLGIGDADEPASHARAVKLVFLRRYAAKLAYELELHAAAPELEQMPGRYATLLGDAVRVEWPTQPWLSDVDEGFYVACYLRAWALELHWRDGLRERFGERWYASSEAGDWLRGLWREGQRLSAEELLNDTLGEELSFEKLVAELT
jgi:hypothetical protein